MGLDSLNNNFGVIGFSIVGIFILNWLVSFLIYRAGAYDEIEVEIAE